MSNEKVQVKKKFVPPMVYHYPVITTPFTADVIFLLFRLQHTSSLQNPVQSLECFHHLISNSCFSFF